MNITVKEILDKEVEISTPCYVKSEMGYHLYHVIDENSALQVCNGVWGGTIGYVSASLAFTGKYSIIKASEFKESFNNVLKTFAI